MKHPITKILLFCPVFLLYTFMLQAQSNLSADGYVHQIDPNGHFLFQGEKQDYIIPADATGLIEFVMEGGDGGYVHPSDVDDFREILSQGNTGNPKSGYVKYVFRGYGPTARCKDVTVTLENGSYTLTGSEVDNNSVVAPGEGKTTGFAVGFGPSQHFESSISFDCTNIGLYTPVFRVLSANGLYDDCNFAVTVLDDVAPVVACKTGPLEVSVGLNQPYALSVSELEQGWSDGCGIVVYKSLSPSEFTCEDVGANTVTLTVTDNNGNTSSCTASVTVEDNIPPVVNCQDITVQLNSEGIGSTNPAFNGALGSRSDNCGMDNSISYTGPIFYTCNEIGPAFPITVTLGDVNGNETPCTYMVTVEDNVAPTALCRDVIVELDENGTGSTTAAAVDNGSGDACGVQSAILSRQSFSCGDLGVNTVTLTVTDVNNNTSTCPAIVTVEDNLDPEVDCSDITVTLMPRAPSDWILKAWQRGPTTALWPGLKPIRRPFPAMRWVRSCR